MVSDLDLRPEFEDTDFNETLAFRFVPEIETDRKSHRVTDRKSHSTRKGNLSDPAGLPKAGWISQGGVEDAGTNGLLCIVLRLPWVSEWLRFACVP